MNDQQSTEQVLELDNVTFRRENKEIIPGLSLFVRVGEHWALLGANGAGKSTLMSLCRAIAHPSSGTVQVLGERLGQVELQALRRAIGHVNLRHRMLSPLTIRQIVLTGSNDMPTRWQPSPGCECGNAAWPARFSAQGRFALAGTFARGTGKALIARALISSPKLHCSMSLAPAWMLPQGSSC